MAGAAHAGVAAASAEYEEVLGCLGSLITQKVRADTGNRGNQWELMAKYVQILELEEPIAHLKVVHVAGTKGKAGHFGRQVHKVFLVVLEQAEGKDW